MSSTTVAIAGFSGKLAQLITNALLQKPNVIVHGIARTASKVPAEIAKHPRVKIFESDASPQSIDKIRTAIRGTSIVVCCYLGDDSVLIDGQKTLIDAAIAEKVPRYLASDYSFDFRGLKMNDIPHKNFQLVINEYLTQKEAEGAIKGVHILNGAFNEVIFSPIMGLYDEKHKVFDVWGSGDEKFEITTYEDTAKFTAEVASDASATGYMKLIGARVSAKEIKAAYDKVYGDELTNKYQGSHQHLIETARALQAKEPQSFLKWVGMLFTYYIISGATHVDGDDRERYGLDVATLEDFFTAHMQDQLTKLMGTT